MGYAAEIREKGENYFAPFFAALAGFLAFALAGAFFVAFFAVDVFAIFFRCLGFMRGSAKLKFAFLQSIAVCDVSFTPKNSTQF